MSSTELLTAGLVCGAVGFTLALAMLFGAPLLDALRRRDRASWRAMGGGRL